MTDASPYPLLFPVRQRFASHAIPDLGAAVRESLDVSALRTRVRAGDTVAIAVGSRGIANLSEIVREVVAYVSAIEGKPVIIPAMGSHGGATAEGQRAVLAKYGVDESIGCPVAASMDTVLVGTTDKGVEVHFDKVASQSDHLIVVNRIKPHTRLVGGLQSGVIKMLMIGLGKHRGACLYHQVFPQYDYRLDHLASDIVDMIIDKTPIRLGLAIVEDAYENTSVIEAIEPKSLVTREPELLEIARSRMPRLPFDSADLLIVDRIGKEISGTGMDTNVVGRKANDKCAAPDEFPKIKQIYVRALTEKTAGNACGIGTAEYTHRRVIQAMNPDVTRINCVTSAHITAGAVPVTFESDRDVCDAVVSQTAADRRQALKWMWISDTLDLSRLRCSRAYLDEARRRDDLEILGDPTPISFDDHGDC